MTRRISAAGICLFAAALAPLLLFSPNHHSAADQAGSNSQKSAGPDLEPGLLEPVEDDMHEFMEYEFEPTFKRLKPAIAADQVEQPNWKTLKAESLILAEGGNLLMLRAPKENKDQWVEHSRKLRLYGGQLYRTAKAKDFKAAREHYSQMVKTCNACHTDFAQGEHQLAE
jgi:hypothetical protein